MDILEDSKAGLPTPSVKAPASADARWSRNDFADKIGYHCVRRSDLSLSLPRLHQEGIEVSVFDYSFGPQHITRLHRTIQQLSHRVEPVCDR